MVAQGSTLQVLFGLLIALVFIKLYGYFKPFEDDWVDVCSEIAMWQVTSIECNIIYQFNWLIVSLSVSLFDCTDLIH
jgi:hypothetical protein